MCTRRRGGEPDANCSPSLNAVFLDFRIGLKTGSCITEGKQIETFSLEG